MNISEKIEEMRSELIKKVMELDFYSEKEIAEILGETGLDNELAKRLILAYRNAKSAKNTVESFWNEALQIRTGAELPIDVAKAEQDEFDTRNQFDNIIAECARQIVLNKIQPEEINEKILKEIYEYGIKEQDIFNPALKLTFHYYCESKSKDIQREEDLRKVQEYLKKVGRKMTDLESQLNNEKSENEVLRKDNATLRSSIKKIQKQFRERISADEKHYQSAVAQIISLREKVKLLEERGIFKTIGDKLFRKKRNELPEVYDKIPSTLNNIPSEERCFKLSDEQDNSTNKQVTEASSKSNSEERQ